MEFCPNCETRLKNSNESLSLVCPKCQYVKEKPGQTKKEKPGMIIPCVVTVFSDKTFQIKTKKPPGLF